MLEKDGGLQGTGDRLQPPLARTPSPERPDGSGPSLESALKHVKPQVRALEAYTLKHYAPRTKLNQNESPFDVPEELKRALWEALASRPWNRYPPFVAQSFIAAVSEATKWPEAGVLVANGSNELIQALLAVVAAPGVGIVIPEPTFTLYRLMTEVGAGEVVPVPLDPELRFDVEAIVAAANRTRAAAIVLCTPNNPTGSALSRAEIERIHEATESLIVLDQAYVEFGGYDAIPLLAGRPRVLVLRTYSKAMAMAGLRAGYLLSDPALVEQINKAKLPYNVNFATEVIAAEVLRNRALLEPGVRRIRAGRDRLLEGLRAIDGLQVFPSESNFVLFRVETVEMDHREVFRRLLEEHGILVRDVSKYPMLERCLRVNAGTEEENEAFLSAMSTIFWGQP